MDGVVFRFLQLTYDRYKLAILLEGFVKVNFLPMKSYKGKGNATPKVARVLQVGYDEDKDVLPMGKDISVGNVIYSN